MRDEATMRDIERAAHFLVELILEAAERNDSKKHPAKEQPGFWWGKLLEERYENHEAWLNESIERQKEEMGDHGLSLVGLLMHGAYEVVER